MFSVCLTPKTTEARSVSIYISLLSNPDRYFKALTERIINITM